MPPGSSTLPPRRTTLRSGARRDAGRWHRGHPRLPRRPPPTSPLSERVSLARTCSNELRGVLLQFGERRQVRVDHVPRLVVRPGEVAAQRKIKSEKDNRIVRSKKRRGEIVVALRHKNT